jgi:hypothetical protein
MAVGNDSVSVKHLWCWATLLSVRFTRFTRFSVAVNHGSTLELKTTLTEDARGAKAAADAGNNCGGMDTRSGFVGGVTTAGRASGDTRRRLGLRGGQRREKTKRKVKEETNSRKIPRRSQDKGISLRALDKREKGTDE